MKFKEIYHIFFEIEEKMDLFNKKIDNVYFWERIRHILIENILTDNLETTYPYPLVKIDMSVKNLIEIGIRSIVNFVLKNPFFSTKKEVLFVGFSRRKLQPDGKWWDIINDPIIQHLNRSYELIEDYYGKGHLSPAKTQNIRYLDFIVLIGYIKILLRITRIKFSNTERDLLNKITEEFKSKLKFKINLEKYVKKDLLIRKASLPLLKQYLQIVNPKLIIGVMRGGRWFPIEAAKDLKIPIIEFQHGVIHPYNLLYSYPGPKRKKRIFADYIFTFGDFWRDSISFPIPKKRIISVGYPFLENEIKRYEKVKKKHQIIFLSSVEVGKQLTKFALEFSRRNRTNFKIVIKLHPGEYNRWKSLYPWLVKSKIEIIDKDEPPLHLLLAESKIQVGVNSTVIYEGLNFGLETYLLDEQWIETMEFLISSGIVKLIKTVEQFEHEIENLEQNSINNTAYFFKPYANQNISKEIAKIIEKNKDN